MTQHRQPAGIPVGGQFATGTQGRAAIVLGTAEQCGDCGGSGFNIDMEGNDHGPCSTCGGSGGQRPATMIGTVAAESGWAKAAWGSHVYARHDVEISVDTAEGTVSMWEENIPDGWEPGDEMPIVEIAYEHGDEADKERAVREAFAHIDEATRPLTGEERCRLTSLERQFDSAGGRGVELAEEIDALRRRAALTPERTGPFSHDGKHQIGDVVSSYKRPSDTYTVYSISAEGGVWGENTNGHRQYYGRQGNALGNVQNHTTGEGAYYDQTSANGFAAKELDSHLDAERAYAAETGTDLTGEDAPWTWTSFTQAVGREQAQRLVVSSNGSLGKAIAQANTQVTAERGVRQAVSNALAAERDRQAETDQAFREEFADEIEDARRDAADEAAAGGIDEFRRATDARWAMSEDNGYVTGDPDSI